MRSATRRKNISNLSLPRYTARDIEIISGIYAKRYLTTTQIHQLYFPASKVQKVCEQRLRILRERGFVRSIEQAVIRSEGRKPLLWALAEGGKALLVRERAIDPAMIETTPWIDESHNIMIKHLLATTDVHIALLKACTTHGVTLEEFIDERELRSQYLVAGMTLKDGGGRILRSPVPDARFVLNIEQKRAYYFLEVDRATIELTPSVFEKRSISKKIISYMAFASSPYYRQEYGTRPLRVLWVVKGERRLLNMKTMTEKILKQAIGFPDELSNEEKQQRQVEYEKLGLRFRFITLDQVEPDTLLTHPVWHVAGQETLHPLSPVTRLATS